ncbi:MAG: UDP-N-acetylglucosamine 4,6-dehydratase (inverting) [Flavobacteriales bacterium]
MELNDNAILVTGGTGSFGKKFVETVLREYPNVKRLVIFSRDELKQYEMSLLFPGSKYPCIRFFIGDVRDKDRLIRAMEGIDIVIHAAALKQVPAAEYNPSECIKTNVNGAENVIEACLANQVKHVVALSTDKAAAPINLYGATKLCSDKLFVAANNIRGHKDIRFSVVRYGNVMGSRGSVIPFFLEKKKSGLLPITHAEMSRFNISLEQGVDLVMLAIANSQGGELYVPKLPSYNILTLANALAPGINTEIVGVRPGEKIHEDMITPSDALNTLELKNYFIIHPNNERWTKLRDEMLSSGKAKAVDFDFGYNSGKNTDWLSEDEIRSLMVEYIDPDFNA